MSGSLITVLFQQESTLQPTLTPRPRSREEITGGQEWSSRTSSNQSRLGKTAACSLAPSRLAWLGIAVLVMSLKTGFLTAAPQKTPAELTALSLESLLNIEVTSVSRREQRLSQSASAVYVITAEDIRRSGATTIPDALRLAPGLQVMQADGAKWSISIRGLAGQLANKLLVMIDGRSVYSPIFAGTYWEANDVLLEDIDRIEVIRGPGATMWGSNAVNGVINIITKHTRETQGGFIITGGGNQEGSFTSTRFGGQAGPGRHYRIYSKYNSRSGLLLPSGQRANDNWYKLQGGFRMDWAIGQRDELLFSGDAYEGHGGELGKVPEPQPPFERLVPFRTSASGANLLARWTRRHSERSLTQFQAYFDRNLRDDLLARDTGVTLGEAEAQHQHDFSSHRFMFGVGYRISRDSTPTEWHSRFVVPERTLQRLNVFVQDEIVLVPGRLLLTAGSKFENNTFTGWVIQPSASLLWNITDQDTFWLSASRAGRSPSRVDRELDFTSSYIPGPQGSLLVAQALGNDAFHTEYLNAFEAGYRFSPAPRVSLDLTAFYNTYRGLSALLESAPIFVGGVPPTTVLPLVFTNLLDTDVYGGELAILWNPIAAGSLRTSYSFLRGGFDDLTTTMGPAHQFQATWRWNLPGSIEWDSGYSFASGFGVIRAYHGFQSRVGWRPSPRWELSVAGRNLLDNQRLEIPTRFAIPNEVGRGIHGTLTWRFGSR